MTFIKKGFRMYTMNAHAKINLGLDIIGVREDGYHLLRMVMQSLKLHDTVTVTEEPPEYGIRTVTDSEEVEDDQRNLAYRAAFLLKEKYGISSGIGIQIKKEIPVAAGLAGGSSDAAAVMKAVNELFSLGLSVEELKREGVKLGADVPYCLEGGTRLSEGIGEVLTPVTPGLKECGILLVKPAGGVSTKEVYEAYDGAEHSVHPDIDGIINDIRNGDITGLGHRIGNVLEDVTIPRVPEIQKIKDWLYKKGLQGVLMSGSGPTVFAIDENRQLLTEAADGCRERFPDCRVILTETCSEKEKV